MACLVFATIHMHQDAWLFLATLLSCSKYFLSLAVSYKLTGNVIFCSASVVEESFYYLDAPVERICGADVPMPYAANLERLAVPQVILPLPFSC